MQKDETNIMTTQNYLDYDNLNIRFGRRPSLQSFNDLLNGFVMKDACFKCREAWMYIVHEKIFK